MGPEVGRGMSYVDIMWDVMSNMRWDVLWHITWDVMSFAA